jgi:hypothetical protein
MYPWDPENNEGKQLIRNAPSINMCKIITCKMFVEFVGSQLVTHLSIQAKNETGSALMRLTDAL